MKDRDTQVGLSWSIALIASGICYLAFSGFMELVTDHFTPVFMWIGMFSMTLGCIAAIASVFVEKPEPKQESA